MFRPKMPFHLSEGWSIGGEIHVEKCELRHTPRGLQ